MMRRNMDVTADLLAPITTGRSLSSIASDAETLSVPAKRKADDHTARLLPQRSCAAGSREFAQILWQR
ncbi:MAG: hypothetical protein HQ518_02445 [Rhodopirellula sp.]|nr:hypothetical protein [Rhodopirellula sp.]